MNEGERFQRAFQDAAIGIALLAVEPLGKYLEVNHTFCRMTGYSREELLARNFQSITASQDVDKNLERLQSLLQGSTPSLQLEKQYIRKNSSAFWARLNVSPVRDDWGIPQYFIVQIEDIDERKRTEEQLRKSEALLIEAQQVAHIGNWNWNVPTNVVTWSDELYRMFGLRPQEIPMTFERFLNYVHPEDRDEVKDVAQKALKNHQPFDHDRRIIRPDGTIRIQDSRGAVEVDAAGNTVRVYGTVQDITDRKQAEKALRESQERYRNVVELSPEAIFINQGGRIVFVNSACVKLLGAPSAAQILGKSPFEFVHPDYHKAVRGIIRALLEGGGPTPLIERKWVRLDGTPVDVEVTSSTLPFEGGTAIQVLARDITARKQVEKALRASEERLGQAIRVSDIGIFDHDHLADTVYWSPAQRKIYGWGPDEPVTLQGFLARVYPEDVDRITAAVRRAHDPAGDGAFDVEHRTVRPDGEVRWVATRSKTYFEGEGGARRPVRTVGAVVDITERKRAEEALRESSQFNQQIITNAREGIIVYDRELRYVVWNPFMEELSGLRAEKVLGKRPRDLPSIYQKERGKLLMEKETVEGIETSIKRAMTGETFSYLDIPFIIKETGTMGWTSVRYGPFRNAQDEIVGVIATVWEITERKRLEEQLRHAQKLEAIGQLAGGVAHEFNNMLTAIIGNLDLALGQIPPESDQHPTLTGALQAARRAAMLTQQLLSFSHRSPVDPQPQDLGSVANEVVHLLRQTIDRRIQVSVRNPDGLWPVLADAGQMHQVIMNLCVNARDSLVERMETAASRPGPARWEPQIAITIENVQLDDAYCKLHYNARPGEYVCVAVSDNGCGIDENVRDRIFEPFFTTKEVGRGTGLGLAAVYGIIKHHEGWIDLSSAKDMGTTFKFCLPRTDRAAVPTLQVVPDKGIAHGSETLLFVDDEASIRRLGQTILEHHGYTVLSAKNGEEALEVFQREHDRIKLVVLDLTMPRMSGREVLKRLLKLDPKVRVLISTGHHMAGDSGELQNLGSVEFVPKPYRPDDLARSVRKLLDASVSPQRQAS